VERTIEQLLASGEADVASADIPLEIQPDALPETAVDAQMARRLTHDWYAPSTPKSVVVAQQQYAQSGASNSHRGTIVTLPDTFLRVPGWRTKGQDSTTLQMAEDERVAMMLQVCIYMSSVLSAILSFHFSCMLKLCKSSHHGTHCMHC
jgi:hypothetical protein